MQRNTAGLVVLIALLLAVIGVQVYQNRKAIPTSQPADTTNLPNRISAVEQNIPVIRGDIAALLQRITTLEQRLNQKPVQPKRASSSAVVHKPCNCPTSKTRPRVVQQSIWVYPTQSNAKSAPYGRLVPRAKIDFCKKNRWATQACTNLGAGFYKHSSGQWRRVRWIS